MTCCFLRQDIPSGASKNQHMRRLGELTIRSVPEEIDKVTTFVGNCGTRIGLRNRETLDAQISADEACSNVIAYAYPGREGGIHIVCETGDGYFAVTVSDDGMPFNPLAIPEPDLTSDLDNRDLGGLGIHLIRSLMDEVDYERRDDKNVLVMKKKV